MANVYPNQTTSNFCAWLLSNSLIRLTAGRKIQIQNVQTAANSSSFVAQLYFEQFVNYTNQFYQQYLQYLNGQPSNPVPSGYDALTTAWLAKVTSPAQQTIYAVDTFFKQLRNDSNLAFDYFYLFAQDQQANAKITLFNPGDYNIVEHGTPVWTMNAGYTGNGSSMYLDTGFKDATNAINFTANSGMIGVYTRNSVTGGNKIVTGANGGGGTTEMALNYTATGMLAAVSSSGTVSSSNSNTQGCFTANRTASNNVELWINGSKLTNANVAVAALVTGSAYIMARNNSGSADNWDNNQYAAAWKGSGGMNQVLVNSAINTLMINLGAHY